jgi:DNA-binding XRE family transcriptional regulator
MAKKQTTKPASALSNTLKKEWAKELYTRGEMTQKDIAVKVGVNEKTIGRWVAEGNWESMRKTLMTTKKDQLTLLYDMLDLLNKAGKASLEDDDPATNPDADRIIKITAAIKKLESETGIGEMVDTLKELISFVQKEDYEAMQVINKWGDLFIKDRLNQLKK